MELLDMQPSPGQFSVTNAKTAKFRFSIIPYTNIMTGPRDIEISEGYNCNLEICKQFVYHQRDISILQFSQILLVYSMFRGSQTCIWG
ncbi:hypothetical protein OROMI_006620 [Orobanche minor]